MMKSELLMVLCPVLWTQHCVIVTCSFLFVPLLLTIPALFGVSVNIVLLLHYPKTVASLDLFSPSFSPLILKV